MPANLKQACVDALSKGEDFRLRLPAVSSVEKALADLEKLPEGRAPPYIDLNQVALEVTDVLRRKERLSNSQLRKTPWCIWSAKPTLAEDATLFNAFLDQLSEAAQAGPFRALASAFIAEYDQKKAGMDAASRTLARLAARWETGWKILQDRYRIFEFDEGPRRLAAEVNLTNQAPQDILRKAGLGVLNAQGGFTESVVRALLAELAEGRDDSDADRLEKVKKFGLDHREQPLFGAQKAEILEALLRPFSARTPPENTQNEFLKIVLAIFGDPRLRPGQWVGLPHRDMVISWLTRQSLRQFLDIVDRTAVEHMFRYRRAFWEGAYEFYRKQNVAVEAWVAFGPRGERLARNIFGQHTSFARLYSDGKQVEEGHAVLLFKIADCIVSDWSHNGKCNIWSNQNDKKAPKLFKLKYGSDEVRIPDGIGNLKTKELFSISHMYSDNYNWQNQVAQRLFELVGLRIPRSMYQVRS